MDPLNSKTMNKVVMDSLSLQSAISDPAIVGTLRTLYSVTGTSSSSLPRFIPSVDTLVAAGASPLDEESVEFMKQLTSGAQAAARMNFYDSIVAGPLSEASDGEFPDIGIWLGSGQFHSGQEQAVLASLGLEKWIQSSTGSEARITTRQFELPAECTDTKAFLAAYRTLRSAYCFCVSTGCGEPTACFLLGEINRKWCGLVSTAVTT